MDIVGTFILALTMSFSHCIGMCGGIVVGYSNMKFKNQESYFQKVLAHLLYNAGRISTYILIGAICGFLGYKIQITPQVSSYFLIVLGVLLIVFAIGFVFLPNFLAKLEWDLHKNGFFKKIFGYFFESKSIFGLYALGVLNGMLPCGMIYYFAGLALATGSVLASMATMAVFGVATSIPLMLVGLFAGFCISRNFRRLFLALSFVFMVGFGVMNIYKGVQKLGDKHPGGHHKHMMHHHHH